MVFGVEEARGLVFLPLRGETELRTDHVFQKMTESQPEFIFYDFSADAIQTKPCEKAGASFCIAEVRPKALVVSINMQIPQRLRMLTCDPQESLRCTRRLPAPLLPILQRPRLCLAVSAGAKQGTDR
jgi:hypothetical protein